LAPTPRTLSGADLGRRLGISRAAVHKQMQQLQALGFAIEPVARAGYRLAAPFTDLVVAEAVLPFLLEPAALRHEVSPPSIGLPYRYVASCASTNVLLKEVAAGAPPGMVIVTDDQTGGRGRLGRGWSSQPGKDLTFSALVRPTLAPARAHLLSLAAALAVADTLEGLPQLTGRVGIKWPNDVLVGDRKVCGILLEGSMDADRLQWAIIGIGLNVNSRPDLFNEGLSAEELRQWTGRPLPTSLAAETGSDVPRAPLFAALLGALARRFSEVEGRQAGAVLAGVRHRDLLRGQAVRVFAGAMLDDLVTGGIAVGIGDEGQLLVRGATGEVTPVFAGDVTLRGPADEA
jgi:BirA family transcriptional regulator, biotin operon repressor / biotin---[acetyl-CoA-carboxylase] ligase